MTESRPPLPPFTKETARQKVLAAEAAWNTRDPARVAAAYAVDSVWRKRDEFFTGREEIETFLARTWERELEYESRDAHGEWWRACGNELWEFAPNGLMRRREASINDVTIAESERRIFGPRPDGDLSGIPLR